MARNGDRMLLSILAALGAGSTVVACGGDSVGSVHRGSGNATGSGGAAGNGGASGSDESGGRTGGGSPGAGGQAFGGFVNVAPAPPGDGGWLEPGQERGTFVVAGRRVACHGDYDPLRLVTGPDADVLGAGLCTKNLDEHLDAYVCFAAPEGGTCNAVYDPNCVGQAYHCGLSFQAAYVCGPLVEPDTGRCCYAMQGSCAVGRPLIVGASARIAPLGGSPGWARRLSPSLAGLDGPTRSALADAYTKDALAEHASVAAFSRFALQCLALGAPAELASGAQCAALDEIEHARIAFGLASAYAGREVTPGALDVAGALEGALDAARVAANVVREGCIAETISALLISAASDAAKDPTVRELLAQVAAEESEHALLSWRFARWALEQGDVRVRDALEEAFARAEEWIGFGARTELPGSAEAMREHGYLPIEERRLIAAGALRHVVMPAARALLGEIDPRAGVTACC